MSMCTQYKVFYWMQRLKPTLPFWWCACWAKNWVIMQSLSQLNAVSTLFLMGKFFIQPFFTKTQGCFLQYPCYLLSGAKSEASLAHLPCVLRPSLGRCLTQQSTSWFGFVFLRMWRWGLEFKVAVSFPCELPVCLEKVAGNRFLLSIWLRSSGQERQDPRGPPV